MFVLDLRELLGRAVAPSHRRPSASASGTDQSTENLAAALYSR